MKISEVITLVKDDLSSQGIKVEEILDDNKHLLPCVQRAVAKLRRVYPIIVYERYPVVAGKVELNTGVTPLEVIPSSLNVSELFVEALGGSSEWMKGSLIQKKGVQNFILADTLQKLVENYVGVHFSWRVVGNTILIDDLEADSVTVIGLVTTPFSKMTPDFELPDSSVFIDKLIDLVSAMCKERIGLFLRKGSVVDLSLDGDSLVSEGREVQSSIEDWIREQTGLSLYLLGRRS